MKPERGQYRSITLVLLDGPDFQQLPPEARWVFVALKISLGPCGIEVQYPEALLAELSARTGFPPATVTDALTVLEAGGWIRRERHVVWVVKQLQFEPAMTPKNEKHRTAVRAHVAGLPRLAIVADFIRSYRDYLDDADGLAKTYPRATDSPSIGYPGAIDSLSNHRDRDRDGIPSTETEKVASPTETGVARQEGFSRGQLLGLIRKCCAPRNGKVTEADMTTNASVVDTIAGRGWTYERIGHAVVGTQMRRDRGEIGCIPAGAGWTLKYLLDATPEVDPLQVGLNAYHEAGQPPPETKRKGSTATIGDVLDFSKFAKGA